MQDLSAYPHLTTAQIHAAMARGRAERSRAFIRMLQILLARLRHPFTSATGIDHQTASRI